ncbi:MAG: MoxR family ATPase [Anaerolineales bacterium]|nr:MoxR family ATPase [Anaerolineales bacterium]
MDTASLKEWYAQIREESSKVLVGMQDSLELMVAALLAGGHVLLEGVPGTAKTLMAKTLAHVLRVNFSRIQFTPDLMPSDILGTSVFDVTTGKFHLKKGPVFTQILLADEINRAPAKTQSALLEIMEERQVSLEGERFVIPPPFLVIATQNPVEFEGTYPLPEAQLDRFLFKILVPYLPLEKELEVLRRYHAGFDPHELAESGLRAVSSGEDVLRFRREIQSVRVEEGILLYIARIAAASRNSPDITLGASMRASSHVLLAAKAYAALQGRDFVVPEDVKRVVHPVYRHRLLLKPEAEIEGLDPEAVIRRLLAQVEVPR